MLILEAALAAILTTRKAPAKAQTPPRPPVSVVLSGAELAATIKKDIESISGPGTVNVSVDSESLFSVRVTVPTFGSEVCNPIYDRELKLYRLFPDFSFDFYLRQGL